MIHQVRFNPPDNYKGLKTGDGKVYTGAAHFGVPTMTGATYFAVSADLPLSAGYGDVFAVVVFVQIGNNKAVPYIPIRPDTGKPYLNARASFTTFGNNLYLTLIDKTVENNPVTDVILMENAKPIV